MCLGIPMRLKQLGDGTAQCEDRDGVEREVNTLLLEAHKVDDWVLVHLDNAIRILRDDEAEQISDAIQAVSAALQGESFDHLFSDLTDREPELPEVLRAQMSEQEKVA